MHSVYSEKDEKPEYWFNLKSFEVEIGKQTPAPNRVGPFKTRLEAEQALSKLNERSAKWLDEDEN